MFVNYFCVWNNIILCYERENITVRYFCGYQHSIVSENGGLIMFEWLNKIFHRKQRMVSQSELILIDSSESQKVMKRAVGLRYLKKSIMNEKKDQET